MKTFAEDEGDKLEYLQIQRFAERFVSALGEPLVSAIIKANRVDYLPLMRNFMKMGNPDLQSIRHTIQVFLIDISRLFRDYSKPKTSKIPLDQVVLDFIYSDPEISGILQQYFSPNPSIPDLIFTI